MGRAIRTGMRVRMKSGPAKGITGTVVDDYNGRRIRWDGETIEIPAGLETVESEGHLERLKEEG